MAEGIRRYKPILVVRGTTTAVGMELVDLESGEAKTYASAVTWTLLDEGGSTVASGTATVSGSSVSASVSGSSTEGYAFSAFWTWHWETEHGLFIEQAALVRSDLHCPLTEQDILDECPELVGIQWSDAAGDVIPWSRFILAAYKDFYGRLAAVRRWPWKVVNPWAFRPFLVKAALSKAFSSLATDDNERYTAAAERYGKAADLAWGEIRVLYDEGESNSPGAETVPAEPVIYLGGSQRGSFRYRR